MKLRRLLVLLVLLLVMTGCSKGKIVEKKAPDIIKMFDNKESFVMYAGTSDCENCKEFKDILGQVLNDYRLTVYYFPADDYEDEDVKNLIYNTYISCSGHLLYTSLKTVRLLTSMKTKTIH